MDNFTVITALVILYMAVVVGTAIKFYENYGMQWRKIICALYAPIWIISRFPCWSDVMVQEIKSNIPMMKTKWEVRNEIKAAKRTIKNYHKAFRSGKIQKDVLEHQVIDCLATIDALRWVLGENDRFD